MRLDVSRIKSSCKHKYKKNLGVDLAGYGKKKYDAVNIDVDMRKRKKSQICLQEEFKHSQTEKLFQNFFFSTNLKLTRQCSLVSDAESRKCDQTTQENEKIKSREDLFSQVQGVSFSSPDYVGAPGSIN